MRAQWTMAVMAAAAVVGAGPVPAAAAPASTVRLIAEWDPGWSAAELGARPRVDDYGVGGLGAYRLDLHGGAAAVCVQADLGHSLDADYVEDARPTVVSPELDYLLWRYLSATGSATDDQAAAINVLSWHYAGATRRGGGPVWRDGSPEVTLDGVRLGDVETQIALLGREAQERRGPWRLQLAEPIWTGAGGLAVRATVTGPAGPIAGVSVRFTTGADPVDAVTGADGVASATLPATTAVRAEVRAPGPLRTFAAPGSQRLAVATEARLVVDAVVAPPPTTSTTAPAATSTTSTSTTTTTTAPATTSTTAPATTTTTTSTTAPPTTATTAPPTTAPSPTTVSALPATTLAPAPSLPSTGAESARAALRWASWAVALGGLSVLASSWRRRSET